MCTALFTCHVIKVFKDVNTQEQTYTPREGKGNRTSSIRVKIHVIQNVFFLIITLNDNLHV